MSRSAIGGDLTGFCLQRVIPLVSVTYGQSLCCNWKFPWQERRRDGKPNVAAEKTWAVADLSTISSREQSRRLTFPTRYPCVFIRNMPWQSHHSPVPSSISGTMPTTSRTPHAESHVLSELRIDSKRRDCAIQKTAAEQILPLLAVELACDERESEHSAALHLPKANRKAAPARGHPRRPVPPCAAAHEKEMAHPRGNPPLPAD